MRCGFGEGAVLLEPGGVLGCRHQSWHGLTMRLLRFTRLVRLSLAGMRLRVSFPVARVFCFVTNSLVATWRMSAGVTTPRVIVEAMDGGTLVAEMKIGLGVQVQVAVGRDEVPDVGFGWTRLPRDRGAGRYENWRWTDEGSSEASSWGSGLSHGRGHGVGGIPGDPGELSGGLGPRVHEGHPGGFMSW